jgi:hypothetical protein
MAKTWKASDIAKLGLKTNLQESVKSEALFVSIELPFTMPGLNGDDGLMRQHWSEIEKTKKVLKAYIIQQCKGIKFLGKVNVTYTRYAFQLMDWDNHCASFKHIGDSLVDCGILIDDKPEVIENFIPKQVKVKRSEDFYTTIFIEKYYEDKL